MNYYPIEFVSILHDDVDKPYNEIQFDGDIHYTKLPEYIRNCLFDVESSKILIGIFIVIFDDECDAIKFVDNEFINIDLCWFNIDDVLNIIFPDGASILPIIISPYSNENNNYDDDDHDIFLYIFIT